MPWRLIVILLFFSLVIVFIGFNLDNTATVSFGFHEFRDVPVFVSLFIAFISGAVVTLPFSIGKNIKIKRKEQTKNRKQEDSRGEIPEKRPKALGFFKKKEKVPPAAVQSEEETVVDFGESGKSGKSEK